MTHSLDTAALLAFSLQAPGWDTVKALLKNPVHEVGPDAPSMLACWSVLQRRLMAGQFEAEWRPARPLFSEVVPGTETIATRAVEVRRQTPARLPAIAALIAVPAAVHGAVRVQRDPHCRTVPENLLRQEYPRMAALKDMALPRKAAISTTAARSKLAASGKEIVPC